MKRLLNVLRAVVALSLVCSVGTENLFALDQKQSKSGDAFRKLHQKAVNRTRRIIFNNDGNEPVYFCKSATEEELLKSRTAPLAGSQADSIFYCTWSSGFGMFTHDTKVGTVFNTREAMFKENRTQEMLDKGIDPLRVMVGFGHQHGMEVFWSMRMNDTHDGGSEEYGPVIFRANPLKVKHPEYLIGTKERRPKYGVWSAVDYGVSEIRDLAFRYCEEVCKNYDVDGIELDFFRHLFFFKCSGKGEPCGEIELQQMTELVRRIRAMADQVGRKRNHPILLAIRVPDSVEYCRHTGLDLERWLAERLVDLMVVSGYTQWNPWEYSVGLGHKYGVKVYPSLDEPRVHDESARKLRERLETYRGRAMNVWAAGGDGVYMFNYFDPQSALWRELGDSKILGKLDRNYFVSVRGVGAMPVPHQQFINVPTLNPGSPIAIEPDKVTRVTFQVGEDVPRSKDVSRISLHAQFKDGTGPDQMVFRLNERELSGGKISGGWLEFSLAGNVLRKGNNILEISPSGKEKTSLLTDLYVAIR